MKVRLTIDGVSRTFESDGMRSLGSLLRAEYSALPDAPFCEDGACAICSVLVDGEIACSCMVPMVHVDGRVVTTIHGLGTPGEQLHQEVEAAFRSRGATPCSDCYAAAALSIHCLAREVTESPSHDDLRLALASLGCRCGVHAVALEAYWEALRRLVAARSA